MRQNENERLKNEARDKKIKRKAIILFSVKIFIFFVLPITIAICLPSPLKDKDYLCGTAAIAGLICVGTFLAKLIAESLWTESKEKAEESYSKREESRRLYSKEPSFDDNPCKPVKILGTGYCYYCGKKLTDPFLDCFSVDDDLHIFEPDQKACHACTMLVTHTNRILASFLSKNKEEALKYKEESCKNISATIDAFCNGELSND